MFYRFKNHGNTCYINATLQALLGLKDFIGEVLLWGGNAKDKEKAHMLSDFEEICVARVYSPTDVDDQVNKLYTNFCEHIYQPFKPGVQQDAGEFLNKMINQFEKEDPKLQLVKNSFHFTYRDVYTCEK